MKTWSKAIETELAIAARKLMRSLEPELTGYPKNVPKSSWAEYWDTVEELVNRILNEA